VVRKFLAASTALDPRPVVLLLDGLGFRERV
jgi:hypothetical protein